MLKGVADAPSYPGVPLVFYEVLGALSHREPLPISAVTTDIR